uniref:Uncharacterized protein n=1 Tax=Blidingia minima TaxID=63414 RepID=A0A8E5N770_9CHLO|nr:hypothetical protein [Blidingia minima]
MRPESHRNFTQAVIQASPFKVEKIRKREGVYLRGIELSKLVLERDNKLRGELLGLAMFGELDITDPEKVQIDEKLYKNYMDILDTSKYKKEINAAIRKTLPTLEEIFTLYFKYFYTFSGDFKQLVEKTVSSGFKVIYRYGAIPTNYKFMGNSPRILPVNYAKSINNTKGVLRKAVYKRFVSINKNYNIIDFDLKSCFTSI